MVSVLKRSGVQVKAATVRSYPVYELSMMMSNIERSPASSHMFYLSMGLLAYRPPMCQAHMRSSPIHLSSPPPTLVPASSPSRPGDVGSQLL